MRVKKFFRRTWLFLCSALVLQLIFNPCMETEFGQGARWVLIALNSLVVIAIIHKVSTQKLQLVLALIVGIPTLVLYWLPRSHALEVAMIVLTGILYLYATFALLPLLLRTLKVGLDELFGAGSLYMLIGLSWALLYSLLELTMPGSFHVADVHNPDGILTLGEFTYYSFVTLTTLGYGDIVPLTCQARALAALEAITGLLTLSVVVARLISLHAARILEHDKKLRLK